jgi:hypothetical protein
LDKQVKVFYVFHRVSGTKDQTSDEIEFDDLIFTLYIKLNPFSTNIECSPYIPGKLFRNEMWEYFGA